MFQTQKGNAKRAKASTPILTTEHTSYISWLKGTCRELSGIIGLCADKYVYIVYKYKYMVIVVRIFMYIYLYMLECMHMLSHSVLRIYAAIRITMQCASTLKL